MSTSSSFSYGPTVTSTEARDFLLRLFTAPAEQVPPVCLWGKHGIGKTELIRDLATEKGWPCVSISPAQFEEMGDLLGLPYLDQQANTTATSRFAPPEWVPRSVGPGILLVDDFNRADDRILRGLMALWQERRLSSWALPEGWFIVLTANPEGDIYSVTPVDEASLTRMLHLELRFDVHSWVEWAQGQQLPQPAIDFMLQNPGIVDGLQTTPRTLSFFFRLWQQYGQPGTNDPQLRLLLESAVHADAAQQFKRFLEQTEIALPDAPTLLAQPTEQTRTLLKELLSSDPPRLDQISLLCNRLLGYLTPEKQLSPAAEKQLTGFLLLEELPPEQVLLLLHGLSSSQHPVLGRLMQERELSRLLLA